MLKVTAETTTRAGHRLHSVARSPYNKREEFRHAGLCDDGYGNVTDVVQLADLPDPTPQPDEVVCDIKAAALNPIDQKTIAGDLGSVDSYLSHRIVAARVTTAR